VDGVYISLNYFENVILKSIFLVFRQRNSFAVRLLPVYFPKWSALYIWLDILRNVVLCGILWTQTHRIFTMRKLSWYFAFIRKQMISSKATLGRPVICLESSQEMKSFDMADHYLILKDVSCLLSCVWGIRPTPSSRSPECICLHVFYELWSPSPCSLVNTVAVCCHTTHP